VPDKASKHKIAPVLPRAPVFKFGQNLRQSVQQKRKTQDWTLGKWESLGCTDFVQSERA